jgi:hypothetical protein
MHGADCVSQRPLAHTADDAELVDAQRLAETRTRQAFDPIDDLAIVLVSACSAQPCVQQLTRLAPHGFTAERITTSIFDAGRPDRNYS